MQTRSNGEIEVLQKDVIRKADEIADLVNTIERNEAVKATADRLIWEKDAVIDTFSYNLENMGKKNSKLALGNDDHVEEIVRLRVDLSEQFRIGVGFDQSFKNQKAAVEHLQAQVIQVSQRGVRSRRELCERKDALIRALEEEKILLHLGLIKIEKPMETMK